MVARDSDGQRCLNDTQSQDESEGGFEPLHAYTNKYYHFLKLGYDTVTSLDSMTLKHDESSRGIIVIMAL